MEILESGFAKMDKADFIKGVRAAEAYREALEKKHGAEKKSEKAFNALAALSKLAEGGSALEIFKRNFTANHGIVIESVDELVEFLKRRNCSAGIVDKKVSENFGLEKFFDISGNFNRQNQYEGCDFGITKASFAVAESGHIVLNDDCVGDRMASIAPWIHVAVLDSSQIVLSISEGLARTLDCPYAIYVGGPSKTTDVEGVLVEGVHGPGVQACLLL